MMKKIAALAFLLIFVSCSNKRSLSLSELERVKWKKIGKGIDHFHWQGKTSLPADSISYKVVGVGDGEVSMQDPFFSPDLFYDNLTMILNGQAPTSKRGYIRMDPFEMMRPDTIIVSLTLYADNPDTEQITKDISLLKSFPGVTNAVFISKEMAKQEYLRDGNADWSKVLTENPLPNSIDVIIDPKYYTEQWLAGFKTKVNTAIPGVADLNAPQRFFGEATTIYFYIEYNRQ